ncbi:MAG: DUF2750 domain-containing protein, partial [Acinetobacter junii]|nr:DUF2750 domain-containing protein [Acinetobacter junii]
MRNPYQRKAASKSQTNSNLSPKDTYRQFIEQIV